jgi:hypothetical protein
VHVLVAAVLEVVQGQRTGRASAATILLFFSPRTRVHWKFVVGFMFAAVAATTPGLYFRPHYFIVLFPAVALLCGAAVAAATDLLRASHASKFSPIPAAIFFFGFVATIAGMRTFLFEASPLAINQFLYDENPFPEALEIANRIREHTAPTDRIAVIGSEPEIYFYADRKSATGYIYTYPLMEKQKFARQMQLEMISEITRSEPKYVVSVNVAKSWLQRPDSDKTIFEWSEKIVNSGAWSFDGIVDILPTGTKYVWGAAAERYEPRSDNFLMLFKRRNS